MRQLHEEEAEIFIKFFIIFKVKYFSVKMVVKVVKEIKLHRHVHVVLKSDNYW